ncbi:hypothetical protein OOU_Y34scaffold00726g69 [Pyricularia oryzae Y34]|nr:hypothetical protein OOU_Y34scaffold00726g69 [Pyricularia oryzae Y34]
MHEFSMSQGAVICLGQLLEQDCDPGVPDGGQGANRPRVSDGHSSVTVPPPDGSRVADGTTRLCGKWYTAEADDSCVVICMASSIDAELFV